MKTSEVLNGAADVIEREGWAKGVSAMSVSGPHCLEGAIQAASEVPVVRTDRPDRYDYLSDLCPAGRAVRDYLSSEAPTWLFMWNDEQSSAGRVIEVLRATAVIEQAREEATAPVEVSA